MLPTLNSLLNYRHLPVISSYVRTHGADEIQATELFQEMLKFLWISRKHSFDKKNNPKNPSLDFTFVMHQEMRDIDNMWHNFILYTKDYSDFCSLNFGEYLHHLPDVALNATPSNEDFSPQMEKYLSYIYDQLGEATVRKWFASTLSDTPTIIDPKSP